MPYPSIYYYLVEDTIVECSLSKNKTSTKVCKTADHAKTQTANSQWIPVGRKGFNSIDSVDKSPKMGFQTFLQRFASFSCNFSRFDHRYSNGSFWWQIGRFTPFHLLSPCRRPIDNTGCTILPDSSNCVFIFTSQTRYGEWRFIRTYRRALW